MTEKSEKPSEKWEVVDSEIDHKGKTYVLLRSTDGKDRYIIRPAEKGNNKRQ